MPKQTGSPVTITSGQPQREVTHFNVSVTYAAGAPSFIFNAFSTVRLRASDDSIVFEKTQEQFLSLSDAQLPAPVKAAFVNVINRLDTV